MDRPTNIRNMSVIAHGKQSHLFPEVLILTRSVSSRPRKIHPHGFVSLKSWDYCEREGWSAIYPYEG